MPRPQIVTWLERMQQDDAKSDSLLTLRKKSYKLVYQKSRSCLGLLACIILESPNKKFSTSQLIDKMMAFMAADRKRIEKAVKMCLSSHKCFIKVSTALYADLRCTAFWTLDKRRMTTNVKGHVKATLELFPGFSSKVRLKMSNGKGYVLSNTGQRNCIPADKQVAQVLSPTEFKFALKKCSTTEWQIVALSKTSVSCFGPAPKPSVQYGSPYSIESLLKKAGPQSCPPPRAAAPVFEGFPLARVQSRVISRLQRYSKDAELRRAC